MCQQAHLGSVGLSAHFNPCLSTQRLPRRDLQDKPRTSAALRTVQTFGHRPTPAILHVPLQKPAPKLMLPHIDPVPKFSPAVPETAFPIIMRLKEKNLS